MITGNERIPLLSGGRAVRISDIATLNTTRRLRVPLLRGGLSWLAADLDNAPANAAVALVSGGATMTAKQLNRYIDGAPIVSATVNSRGHGWFVGDALGVDTSEPRTLGGDGDNLVGVVDTVVPSSRYSDVMASITLPDQIVLTGDQTVKLTGATIVRIAGSTSNNAIYPISHFTVALGDTTLFITGSLVDDTADGTASVDGTLGTFHVAPGSIGATGTARMTVGLTVGTARATVDIVAENP